MKKKTKSQKLRQARALQKLLDKCGSGACEICGRLAVPGKRFVGHHVDYENDIVALLCYQCHTWLHGQGPVWSHEFKTQYGKDKAPYEFAKAVVRLYERKCK